MEPSIKEQLIRVAIELGSEARANSCKLNVPNKADREDIARSVGLNWSEISADIREEVYQAFSNGYAEESKNYF